MGLTKYTGDSDGSKYTGDSDGCDQVYRGL